MARLNCHSCGANVEVPAAHRRARIRCSDCGYYVDIPAEYRNREPDAEVPVTSSNTQSKKDKKAPPPLLVGTQDDDGLPYTVPGDLHKKCTGCYKEIDYDATFCIHCGIDFSSGKKAKKTYESINRTWDERYSRNLRLKAFFGLQILNLILAICTGSITGGISFLAIQAALQAFLIGTYATLNITRTSKGAATLKRQRFFFFFPGPDEKLDWKASQGVGIIAMHQPGIIEWITFLYLLLCTACLPGLLFYWFVMRPDRFHVSLCDVYGSTNEIAFRTTDRDMTDEICRTISDATGLWYKPVM